MNEAALALMSQEEIEHEKKKEAARRKGNRFIEVLWVGYPSEPEQLRFHGIVDVHVDYHNDPNSPGRKKMSVIAKSGTTKFNKSPISGELTAELWDDPEEHNRIWLSRAIGVPNEEGEIATGIEVVDDRLREEIEKLRDKEWFAELPEKHQLLREKKKLEKKIADIEAREKKTEKKVVEAAPRRKRQPVSKTITLQEGPQNGDNQSTPNVGGT